MLLKKENINTFPFASTDKVRPALQGLIIDEDKVVATDGMTMIITKADMETEMLKWKDIWKDWDEGECYRIGFNPEKLVKILKYWIENVHKTEIWFQLSLKSKKPTLQIEDRDRGIKIILMGLSERLK